MNDVSSLKASLSQNAQYMCFSHAHSAPTWTCIFSFRIHQPPQQCALDPSISQIKEQSSKTAWDLFFPACDAYDCGELALAILFSAYGIFGSSFA